MTLEEIDPQRSCSSRSWPVPAAAVRGADPGRCHDAGVAVAVAGRAGAQGDALVLRGNAGDLRRVGPVRFRLSLCSRPDHIERAIQDPGPRHRADPVPAGAGPVRDTRATGNGAQQRVGRRHVIPKRPIPGHSPMVNARIRVERASVS